MRTLAFVVCMVAAASASADDTGISFARDVAPILRDQCATCHLTGAEAGNMALHPRAAYASIVGRPSTVASRELVKPGFPDESYLMAKLDGTHVALGGNGERMPFGAAPLPEADRQKIRKWIAEGAKNN